MLALLVNMQGFQSLNNIIEDITIIFPKQEMELSAVEGHSSKEYVPIPRNGDNTAAGLVYCGREGANGAAVPSDLFDRGGLRP